MARKPRPRRAKQPEQRAKVFWTGRSQAVRLPKEFRFEGDSVRIRKNGGLVILEDDREGEKDWHAFLDWLAENPIDLEIPPRSKKNRKIPDW